MLLYAAIFALGIVAALTLRRVLAVLLRGAAMIGGVVIAGRVALLVDGRLADRDWLAPLILGGFGAGVVMLLVYRQIHNWLVDADLQRQLERDRQQAAARRI